MSGRGLAAFAAGFGTGYLNAEQRKKEQERQARIDEIQFKKAQREEDEYNRNKAVDDQANAVETVKYQDKRAMTADDVRKMTGGSSDVNSPNYVSDEAAQHYIQNNTGADQVKSNANYYSQNVVGAGLGAMKPMQEGGEVKLGDEATAKKRPSWKILEEQAKIRIGSGVPQQVEMGKGALALATQMKSQAALEGGRAAMQKDGVKGLMEFMSNWDSDDYPVTNIRMNQGENGTTSFVGEFNGKEIELGKFDPAEQPKGMTLDAWVAQKFQELVEPSAMFKNGLNKLSMAREDARDAQNQKNADRNFDYTVNRDGIKDEQWKMSFNATEAQRRFDNNMSNKKFNADEAHRANSINLEKEKLDAKGADGKSKDNFRQDYNAAISVFDKSFKRDAMGNMIGSELNSKVYAEAADVIGKEILQGIPINVATAVGRKVYDEALKGKVSVSAAYEALKKRQQAAPSNAAQASGAAAVDSFFK